MKNVVDAVVHHAIEIEEIDVTETEIVTGIEETDDDPTEEIGVVGKNVVIGATDIGIAVTISPTRSSSTNIGMCRHPALNT